MNDTTDEQRLEEVKQIVEQISQLEDKADYLIRQFRDSLKRNLAEHIVNSRDPELEPGDIG